MTTIAMMQMRVQPNELKRNLWHMRELLSPSRGRRCRPVPRMLRPRMGS